jgi:hypothetical protein
LLNGEAAWGRLRQSERSKTSIPSGTVARDPRRAASPELILEEGGMSDLRIGDQYIIHARSYVICGFEPMSLPGRNVELEDLASSGRSLVPINKIARWRRIFRPQPHHTRVLPRGESHTNP